LAPNEQRATELGQRLVKEDLIMHVLRDHQFKNEKLFFRFHTHDKDRGHADQEKVCLTFILTLLKNGTWKDLMEAGGLMDKELEGEELVAAIKDRSDFYQKNPDFLPEMLFNEENCEMWDQVRPINWVDPKAEVCLNFYSSVFDRTSTIWSLSELEPVA
jgi:hypothetical protein